MPQKILHPLRAILPFTVMVWGAVAQAADRDKLIAFMEVTGFDVALDSLRLSAGSAPQLLGLEENDFGTDWTRMADEVFESQGIRTRALDILEATLSDEALAHAAAFYASDLGQRLVAAENASHMQDDDVKAPEGQAEAARLMQDNPERIAIYQAMTDAIGSEDSTIRAIIEVQVRFLMSAQAAGLIDGQMDEQDLRGALGSQADSMRLSIQANSISGNAYTYRDFSDADVEAYLAALEEPLMQEVYELMTAVQFTIMADRFEVLAARMVDLHPSQEL